MNWSYYLNESEEVSYDTENDCVFGGSYNFL